MSYPRTELPLKKSIAIKIKRAYYLKLHMEEFTLKNKKRDPIKIFKPFEDVMKSSPTINAMEIKYAFVYKRSSKLVIKGSRVESIEEARKEYKQLSEDGWMKTSIFKSYF